MTAADLETALSKSWLVRNGYSAIDTIAVLTGLLLAVAYATFFFVPSWTPRMAVLLVTLPFGAVLVVRQAIRREPLALAAACVVAASVLSAAFSGEFRLSLLGVVGSETGVLITVGSLGLLAIGSELSEKGRRALVWAVIVGVALSGAIGLLQMIVQADSGPFIVRGGRASGLTPSSVYFGACAAGAFGLVAGRVSTNKRTVPLDAALAVWFGLSIGLSGTRVALGGAVVVAVIAVVSRRQLRAVVGGVGLMVGIVVGRLVAAQVSTGVGAADRLRLNGGGRTTVWRYALDSFFDRPLVGYGPGGFREAIQDDVTVTFSARVQDNIESVWFNAHNYALHTAATLGIVGLLALGLLALVLLRYARGPLALGGLALVLSWSLQPFSLSTMPMALLLLGGSCASALREGGPEASSSADRVSGLVEGSETRAIETSTAHRVSPFLLAPGLLLAGFLLVFDLSVQSAIDRNDPEAAAAWVERMPPDPLLADVVAQLYLVESRDNPAFAAETVEWGERAIAEQPDRSLWYVRHGERLARLGNLEGALAALEAAQEREPNSWQAVEGQFFILQALGRDADAEALRPLACDLQVIDCTAVEDPGSSPD